MTGIERVFNDCPVTQPAPEPAAPTAAASHPPLPSNPAESDARSRILTAAITLFGRGGYAATSVRSIATEAGVSAPLVIHHFGGKEGLRRACDQQLVDCIDQITGPVLRGEDPADHVGADDVAALRQIVTYMISVIREGGEAAQSLFTKLTEQNLNALESGVRAGTVRPTGDAAARAALTVAYSLAEHLLGDLIAGYLGTEPRSLDLQARVGREAIELYTHGLFEDERLLDLFVKSARHPTADPNAPDPHVTAPTPPGSTGKDAAATSTR